MKSNWQKELKCKKCGYTIPSGTTKCPHCGAKVNILPGCLMIITLLLVIGFLFYGCSTQLLSSTKSNTQNIAQKLPAIVVKVQEGFHVTTEQAQVIADTLNKCGISEIDKIDSDETLNNAYGEGGKGYRVTVNRDIKNVVVYISKEGNLDAIRWVSQNLYKDGTVISKVSDFYLTINEQSKLQSTCKESIKKLLRAPKSADFPNITEWRFSKDKEKIIVQSYVDAQNSFGANIRSQFQFTFTPDGQTVKSLIFEGKKYDF